MKSLAPPPRDLLYFYHVSSYISFKLNKLVLNMFKLEKEQSVFKSKFLTFINTNGTITAYPIIYPNS